MDRTTQPQLVTAVLLGGPHNGHTVYLRVPELPPGIRLYDDDDNLATYHLDAHPDPETGHPRYTHHTTQETQP